MSAQARNGRSTPRSGRGRRTRDAVLAAAVSVFGREGVRQTSMLAIAQEAGVASGTVYQYFSDKEDIFRALLGQLDEELRAVTRPALDDGGRLKVHETVQRYLGVHRRHGPVYRAWWDLLEPRTEFTDAWLDLHEQLASQIEGVVRDGQADGRVAGSLDPALTGQLVAMLFERQAYSRTIMGWDEELTDEEVSELVAGLVDEGLVGRSER